ncbi:hypothetical protein HA520_19305 [Azotobacter chroococcum]|uniref:Apea-like HEPN domain-containing protein n=1 Tax=Azotobacter chroococcum TaxID=353 RepID=A0AA43ZBW6_9GAMM|nr:hypothetical protein [Azotobacter chroococcum]NHN79397.1 hypothetical protein [Azotobacter chroococcum]
MKDYYGKRSAVAHGGSKLITDAEFYTLLVICGSVIMKVIEMLDSCSSQNDLMDWIQDKRLS